ncbi:MAG: hypothetical protein PHT69_07450 [Bacteroidales bacterium]|nr:hypothetical protein [Bacteroidales bacterium]
MKTKFFKIFTISNCIQLLKLIKFVSFFLLIVFLNACVTGKRTAYKFIDNSRNINILILEPDLVIKSNLKIDRAELNNIEDPVERNNVELSQSDFLYDLDVNWVSEIFMSELKKELNTFGVNVFTSSKIDTFFTQSTPAYMFSISQVEIEEFFSPFKEEYERSRFDSVTYVQEFSLNALNFNSWYEYSELNTEKKKELLFSNFYISDNIQGYFYVDQTSNEVKYSYTKYSIGVEDIEKLIRYAGKMNAQYMYNYILNKYIREHAPYEIEAHKFFVFNPALNILNIRDNYRQFRTLR